MLGEAIEPVELAGGTAVLAGMWLVTRPARAGSPPPPPSRPRAGSV
jgi:drug/metabolite transporter (DMT)-like permease